jgi:hypothetical protein
MRITLFLLAYVMRQKKKEKRKEGKKGKDKGKTGGDPPSPFCIFFPSKSESQTRLPLSFLGLSSTALASIHPWRELVRGNPPPNELTGEE